MRPLAERACRIARVGYGEKAPAALVARAGFTPVGLVTRVKQRLAGVGYGAGTHPSSLLRSSLELSGTQVYEP